MSPTLRSASCSVRARSGRVFAAALWLCVTQLLLFAFPTVSGAQPVASLDSARADLPLIRRADAARTRGIAQNGAIDTLRPTIHEFIDHACPSCREFTRNHGDSLTAMAASWRANLVIRVAPIPGLLRGAHAAEAAFCAGGIGGPSAFDAVHRALLDDQGTWRFARDPLARFLEITTRAGVDSVAMRACLRTGATRPLVLSDARLAGQYSVEGTPTILVTRPGPFSAPIRVVGELLPKRIGAAVSVATPLERAVPTAFTMLGTWSLDSLSLTRWQPITSAASDSAARATQHAMARTLASLRAGTLRIETEFDASFRYRHRLLQGTNVAYEETGAWAAPTFASAVHVMRDDGGEGTYHAARIVYGDQERLVLEITYLEGPSAGWAERIFLVRAPRP